MHKILHIGLGNFHRAHQAWYTQNANLQSGEEWKITGVSLQRPDMRNALAKQENLYTLVLKGAEKTDYQKMTVLEDVLFAIEDAQLVLNCIANPAFKVVTLTVTEKGYCYSDTAGGLDLKSTEILQEFETGKPQTAIGYLAYGLALRKAKGGGPITIVSCDNLPDNGHILKLVLLDFCKNAGIDIGEYVAEYVSFPNTMVDRIVPSTTFADKSNVFEKTGFADGAPVCTEEFSEWVIEDDFKGPMPAWDKVGAKLVVDVKPYEMRKLRLLNGSHSLLAYCGLLRGHEFVHQAIADPVILEHVRSLMAEAIVSLEEYRLEGMEIYCEALIQRFSNASLPHQLSQIAKDGTEKLPIRILPVLRGQSGQSTAQLAVANWLAFVLVQLAEDKQIGDPKEAAFIVSRAQFADENQLAEKILNILDSSLDNSQIIETAFELIANRRMSQ